MSETWYDEAFDASGSPRRRYLALHERLGWDPLHPSPQLAHWLRERPFGDDTRIFPVPLAMDEHEYRSVIQSGVAQRALALQRFFADVVHGPLHQLHNVPGLSAELLDMILAAEGLTLESLRRLWRGHGEEEIRFVYGPDLVRCPDGRPAVLEDNVGCVGGSADAFFVSDRYREATGLDRTVASGSDLAVAVLRWLDRLGLAAEDIVAVLGCEGGGAQGLRALRLDENSRRRHILDDIGVPVVDVGQAQRSPPQGVVNFDIDARQPGWLRDEAFARLALFNAPGTGLLGNKALLPFAADLIRAYCEQEPILQTLHTRLLSHALPEDPAEWVVKTSTGCQGTEVFVLRTCAPDRLAAIEELLLHSWPPAGAVVQRYVERSRLAPSGPGGWDAHLVELRPVTYVLGWADVLVSDVPLGRVISNYDARRLSNISQGACYLPVLRG